MAQPITTSISQNDTLKPFSETGFSNPSGIPFAAWNTERDGSGPTCLDCQKITEATSPLTLYAQWGLLVNWDSQGGTACPPSIVQPDQQVGTLPTTTRSEFTLNGWYTEPTGGTQITAEQQITDNTTFYAQWTGNQYSFSTNYSVSSSGGFSDDMRIFSNRTFSKGTWSLKFNNVVLKHFGKTTGCKMVLLVCIKNPSNNAQLKHITLARANTTITGSPRGINFSTYSLHTSSGGVVTRENLTTLYGTGYGKDETSGQFGLTINSINLPYAKNTLWIQLYADGNEDGSCKGGNLYIPSGTITKI